MQTRTSAETRNRALGAKLYYDIMYLFRKHHYRIMKPNRRFSRSVKMKKS